MVSSYVIRVLLAATKVVAWFCIIFILLPRHILSAPPQGLSVSGRAGKIKRENRVWADVVRIGFYTIIIVHLLVLAGIYDLLSLTAGYALLYLLLLFLRPEGLPRAGMERVFTRFVTFGLDALERRVRYGELVRQRWNSLKAWIRRQTPSLDQILWGLALFWVLLVSIYLRLYETMNHAAFTPASYSHLKWLKGLTRRELYVDGIYPYGAFTLLSGLKTFTFLDEAMLLRVAQGLTGGLTVAAIHFAIHHFSGRRDAALLGASLYGIFTFAQTFPGLPLYPNEALPLEMALAFLLPTWVFLTRYLTEREPVWLGLAFQGTVTVLLIHPLVGAVTLAGWVLALPASLIYGRWRGHGTLQMTLAAVGTVILGNIFYVIGHLGGRELVENPLALTGQMWERWIEETARLPDTLASEAPLFFVALLAIPLLLLLGGDDDAQGARYSARAGRVTLALVLLGTAILIEASQQLGWSKVFASRIMAAVASLLACAVLGVAYGMVVSWVSARVRRFGETRFLPKNLTSLHPLINLGATIAILSTMLVASPPLMVKGASKAGYDAVAIKIYDIKEEHLAYTWTVVGVGEMLPHILGRGWYLNGEYFLQNYAPDTYCYDPEQPELGIPTEHVYIIVEKNVYAAPSTAKGLYQRDTMEQGLWDWCKAYGQSHDNMTIYYEDNDIAIYHIHHPLLPVEPGVVPGVKERGYE
ncbi:MAG: hypothetical protein SWK90_14550 [Chloroflexota bacterium]|nr:hypothetical protein [Chloroflexota bacterium]